MERERSKRMFIIMTLFLLILCLSVAFAAFSQSLKINGEANVESKTSNWNIMFSKINTTKTTGYATGSYDRQATGKLITFTCEFVASNDACEISATILNKGTINALYTGTNVTVSNEGVSGRSSTQNYNDGILSITLTPPVGWEENTTILQPNESGIFNIRVQLNDIDAISENTQYTFTANFHFEQANNY